MNAAEDDDLKLLRASATLLTDLEGLLPRILRNSVQGSTADEIHPQVRALDLGKVFARIECFQEDPQLLDSHLKSFIPPLVAAYLDSLRLSIRPKPKKGLVPLTHAVCQILNLFCKVRGEKVIKGFFNNEPRYLEPILLEFENGSNFATRKYGEAESPMIVPWTERHILLLWLSHLMLAPFPLATISALQNSKEVSAALGIKLPSEVPGITLRVLVICVEGLQSATKERGSAANLLVRLCVRPDMQELGLLDSLVKWSLSFFSRISEKLADIHQCLGILTFLSGLATSATNEEIGPSIPAIYQSCQSIISQGTLTFVKSSAVARKLVIKTLRNIVVHCLQAGPTSNGLDSTSIIEEVIEFLLDALADGDTPVRYAASKALSIITMKLDPDMAGEVVEAVLGSLNENVYWQASKRILSGVNPLRWHGLTLTLSHLLYRKALSTTQLPEVLNALLLTLSFEQRSATGGSIGTNVRDAACFGIWAVSRRYATKDLLAVDNSSVRASEHYKGVSIIQVLAVELLVVACLDPAGNIRRGSSAALQELIGRHPDIVEEGIPLVQVVDFHAVGLRERAMTRVAAQAALLRHVYWEALFENLLGWRGIGSLDAASRQFAASAIGLLAQDQSHATVQRMANRICDDLRALKQREIEERQGVVLSLSALINHSTKEGSSGSAGSTDKKDLPNLLHLWTLLDGPLNLEAKSFTSPALRPEFTASSICIFLGAMASLTIRTEGSFTTSSGIPTEKITRLLTLCLGRYETSVMDAIPSSASKVIELLQSISTQVQNELVLEWLLKLEQEASYNGRRWSGYAVALGAIYPLLGSGSGPSDFQTRIVKTLTFRCTPAVSIEARAVALQALSFLLMMTSSTDKSLAQLARDQIANALHLTLNDYTITERGDVGSLVRLEAISTTGVAWSSGLIPESSSGRLSEDVLRLSLEKLDKVRARAAQVLEQGSHYHLHQATEATADSVSSYEYFASALTIIHPAVTSSVQEAVLLGVTSSAGMGSESVVQNSRAALLDALDALSDTSTEDSGALSVHSCVACLVGLLKQNLDSERILLPLLEIFAFLFDMQIMHRLTSTTFNFRVLLSLTQKAHFKSTHMQKLLSALDMYRGLGTIPSTKVDTIIKVVSMLLHPFPKVRISAAETLWVLTQEEGLKMQDWSLPPKNLKSAVNTIKGHIKMKGHLG
ncbi:hypothetical protein EJ04DRAFT_427615 [Polyplosphaeria fusca]|uniref:Tubulin-specific chaperone D n=1 Tax=Polyplosphaeria fusca TaxID=682080 RepID=A0A9P4R4A3_9PLEO|nr:hypothetical protein EJ04DRAFT_427615 [Polyplosphaeria fusca]